MNNLSKPKVFIDGIIFSLQTHGGISVFWGEVIKRMIKDRCEFLLSDTPTSRRNDIRKSLEIHEENISAEPQATSLLQRLRPIKVPQDYLFTSTYYRSPGKQHPCQLAVVYDLTHEHHIPGLRSAVHSWAKRRALRQAHHTLTISQSTKNDLLNRFKFIKSDSVSVIYPGCSSEFFQFRKKASLSSHGQLQGPRVPFALFIGSRKPYKNFDVAVEAVTRVRGYHLTIVGGGPLSMKERKLLEAQLGGRYDHHQGVSDEMLNVLFNHANVLLYPSTYEGFGIPIVEAMAAGCPVIASNSSSIPEAAGEAAMLIDNISAHSLAEAIVRLKKDDVRCELIGKGLEHARKFTWESTYSQLIKVFEVLYKKSYL